MHLVIQSASYVAAEIEAGISVSIAKDVGCPIVIVFRLCFAPCVRVIDIPGWVASTLHEARLAPEGRPGAMACG